ncbi:MAG: CCA tRNA nucleotidyltransferase [Ruminococcaceae bacterium]|nr:CCA tRNA nucleotidyltransferase [Oscillospiraceae bacterium]
MKKLNISLPEHVLTALNTLESNGFECYCVGGAIRDIILGKKPFDFDITTNATPDDITRIFDHTVPTGLKHGTVTVVIDKNNIEITTYRSEDDYSDHRSPDSVRFLNSVEGDVMRRDFTMNAVLYNPKKGIYDPVNGLGDINDRLIRAVGEPSKRFTEDALRIMRAFRFCAQLDFSLEKKTLEAALKLSETVKILSRERIFSELQKTITAKFPQNADPLFECGTFEFLRLNLKTSLSAVACLPCDFSLRFSYLCYLNSLDCKAVLKALKSDNETVSECEKLLGLFNSDAPKTKYELKILLNQFGIESVQKVLNSSFEFFANTKELKALLNDIITADEPYKISHLSIGGNELKALGFEGEQIGAVLAKLLDKVMQAPELNNSETLKKLAVTIE